MTLALAALLVAAPADAPPVPLPRAHAHNDYEHPRPLRDALDHGFCSVEADVYLTANGLLVAHTPFGLKPERTLEKLYLAPLRDRVKAHGGRVHTDGPPFFLLVDVKTDAKTTTAAVVKALEGYADIVSVSRDGKFEPKAVTVVVTGNADRDTLTKPAVRYAAIDGRPADLDSDAPADLVPWVSADWRSQFKWTGTGPMPEAERAKLAAFVAKAHARGRKVRFWASPDKPAVWTELLAADADLINTDDLPGLRRFLADHDPPRKP